MTAIVRLGPVAAVAAAALLLTACGGDLDADGSLAAGRVGCVDDSPRCVQERSSELKTLVADPSRKWVREPATAGSYATGVRLFAFKSRKRELTCDELGIGRREADGAAAVLRGPQAGGLTPAQISRGVMFGAEVSKELAAEQKRRCKA
jgi:hypothetical protein